MERRRPQWLHSPSDRILFKGKDAVASVRGESVVGEFQIGNLSTSQYLDGSFLPLWVTEPLEGKEYSV